MRHRLPFVSVLVASLALGGCIQETTRPQGTPIDCSTLATSLATTTDLTTTASGLRFRDVRVGTGALVSAGTQVAIFYAGCLTTGAVFDEGLDNEAPLQFFVGTTPLAVIAGFDEGMRGMRVGGIRQLVIPPELGYGSTARGPLPANSTLVFTVELVGAR